jgi:hypothetical protein
MTTAEDMRGHMVSMREKAENPVGTRPIRRPRLCRKNNIKKDLKEIGATDGPSDDVTICMCVTVSQGGLHTMP